MYDEDIDDRPRSGSGFIGFMLGVVATVLVALGLLAWTHSTREAPIRTAELSIPIPEIPAPPGTIPSGDQPAPEPH